MVVRDKEITAVYRNGEVKVFRYTGSVRHINYRDDNGRRPNRFHLTTDLSMMEIDFLRNYCIPEFSQDRKVKHDAYAPFESGDSIYWRRGVKYLCLGAEFEDNEMFLECINLDAPGMGVEYLPVDNTSEFKSDIRLEYLESVFKIGTLYTDVEGNSVVVVSYMVNTNDEGRYEPAIIYRNLHSTGLLAVRGVTDFVKKFGFNPKPS